MRETLLRSRGSQKLIGVRSSFVGNRNRFTAPDQLPSATAEALPPSNRILRRCPIGSSVPTLHRLHRDPIADFEWTACQRPAQRRLGSCLDLGIARDSQIEGLQMILEASNIFQTPDAKDCSSTHAALRRSGRPKTASPPINARATST